MPYFNKAHVETGLRLFIMMAGTILASWSVGEYIEFNPYRSHEENTWNNYEFETEYDGVIGCSCDSEEDYDQAKEKYVKDGHCDSESDFGIISTVDNWCANYLQIPFNHVSAGWLICGVVVSLLGAVAVSKRENPFPYLLPLYPTMIYAMYASHQTMDKLLSDGNMCFYNGYNVTESFGDDFNLLNQAPCEQYRREQKDKESYLNLNLKIIACVGVVHLAGALFILSGCTMNSAGGHGARLSNGDGTLFDTGSEEYGLGAALVNRDEEESNSSGFDSGDEESKSSGGSMRDGASC